jgi:enamine deaminase RidA (YjgF/YER057c/UK114 family)
MSDAPRRVQTNSRMSQVVVANGFAFVSGQIPMSSHADVAAQSREVLTRIDDLLEAAGTDRTRLVSANVWLTSAAHFATFNDIWDAWLPDGHAPARACVQAQLMKPGIDVEVAVVALV